MLAHLITIPHGGMEMREEEEEEEEKKGHNGRLDF
jgi:hypothetical protein